MLPSKHEKRVQWRDLNYWDVLAIISGTITAVAALGEWVFHWWKEPGDVVSYVGVLVTLLAAGFGASKRDMRGLQQEFRGFRQEQRHAAGRQEKLIQGQAEQTALLEQMVAFFRPRS